VASNGNLPKGQLSRIYHPDYEVYLSKEAAAAWNTLRLVCKKHLKVDIYPLGANSAYRSYESQEYFWHLYQSGKGNLAARPGTSNHGWGNAVDLASMPMRGIIDRLGGRYGWKKIEAPSEWWHVNYVGGFNRPNPGTSVEYPVARFGSGGRGQRWFVKKLQRRLKRHGYESKVDGSFGRETGKLVREFQKAKGLRPDGVVGKQTWQKLNSKPSKKPVPAPQKPSKPSGGTPSVEKPLPKPPKPVEPLKATVIDVSNHQGDIDWKKVKADGISGVYLKLSEGEDWPDPSMTKLRIQEIKKAGLEYGWYHFLRPKDRDAAREARYFIKKAEELGGWGDWLPVADIEVTALDRTATANYLARFISVLRREGDVPRVVIYASPGWWKAWCPLTDQLHAQLPYCVSWIAHWNVEKPIELFGIQGYVLHQYTDSGKVSGIKTPVDMNRCPDLRQLRR
jgi:GH25 family lysozyme M1 (1,4-beta-N-acetylmuramidase)